MFHVPTTRGPNWRRPKKYGSNGSSRAAERRIYGNTCSGSGYRPDSFFALNHGELRIESSTSLISSWRASGVELWPSGSKAKRWSRCSVFFSRLALRQSWRRWSLASRRARFLDSSLPAAMLPSMADSKILTPARRIPAGCPPVRETRAQPSELAPRSMPRIKSFAGVLFMLSS